MIQILLHSSKTMSSQPSSAATSVPQFKAEASELANIWKQTSPSEIANLMKIADKKAAEVVELYQNWTEQAELQSTAIDSFRGDIYSGLQVQTWSNSDRGYAHDHLIILSGLYGALRPLDGIMPYRLEMGYKLPDGRSMYSYWVNKLSGAVPAIAKHVINLSAVEYTKAILPYISSDIITPKFLTISPKTDAPTFVTVHAKIARGAFARWLIQNKIQDIAKLPNFNDLGYHYDSAASTPEQPVFVCSKFDGLGLSVRNII